MRAEFRHKIGSDVLAEEMRRSGGFTMDIHGDAPKAGFAVGVMRDRSRVIPADIPFARLVDEIERWRSDNADVLSLPDHYQGGWHDKDEGVLVLDITRVWPPDQKEEAMRFAKDNDERSIYDLATGETIDTGGTGGYVDKAARKRHLFGQDVTAEEMARILLGRD